MAEAIAEMVLPGTYIEVRSEGLISVGAISTGNIGIVGTAARGPKNAVRAIGSYAEALDLFGPYDAYPASDASDSHPLTLTRALERAFGGGARDVFAVRIANGDLGSATADLKAFLIVAVDPGSWGNDISYKLVNTGTSSSPSWTLTLIYGPVKETFSGGTAALVRTALGGSTLVKAVDVTTPAAFVEVASAKLTDGTDGADVGSGDVDAGLAALADQEVNIVLVAGIGSDVAGASVATHLDVTESDGRERIAILGLPSSGAASDVAALVTEAGKILNDRIVLVAPGLLATDAPTGRQIKLPPPYLAATVAGMLSTLAPQISLTNKTAPIAGLDVSYSTTAYKTLLQNRVLLVRKKLGFQVVKGITTDAAAFRQISVRRIVDYAKTGVRSGSDPYIGRLNNARVRAALKATLDGFLSQMVLDEMLVGYELEVKATRAQEIQGICAVTMTLLPTFSIDFIRVTMNLQ